MLSTLATFDALNSFAPRRVGALRITTAEIAAIPQVVGLWNPNEPESLFEEGSGQTAIDTGTPSTLGGPVGTQRDWSGNNHHRIITLPAARPTAASLGGRTVLSYDGADDNLRLSGWTGGTANMRVFAGLQTSDDLGVIMNAGDVNSPLVGVFDQGSSSTSLAGASSQFSSWLISGVEFKNNVNTRDDTYAASATGAPVVHEFVGVDLGEPEWAALGFYFYSTDPAASINGYGFVEIIVDESVTPLSADELALIRAYMAQETTV